jgi:hypothetical protein
MSDAAKHSLAEARRLLEEAEEVSPEDTATGPQLKATSEIQPRPVRWLWPDHIPLGKLTIIGGNPGLGKSFLATFLAERTTTGRPWPDGSPGTDPGGVLLVSAEDDPEDTTVPRLVAAGANRERVFVLQGIQDVDEQGRLYHRPPSLEGDVPHLATAIDRVEDCRLVVLDPISAYMGGTDSHKNTEVRGILAPLAELAQSREVAIVGITHLNKGAGEAIYRMMGSLAFVAAARTAWAVAADKEDPARRLFVPVKNNLGNDRQGLAYRIEAVPRIEDSGRVDHHDQPALRWEDEPIQVSADEALAPAEERSERDEAAEWIQAQLEGGPRPVKDLQAEAKAAGLGWESVKKAKARVGVKSTKRGFSEGWFWALPGQLDEEEGRPSQKGPGPSQRPPSGQSTSSPENKDLQRGDSSEECEGGQPGRPAPLGGEWEEDV